MNNRERVTATLEHKQPDRVPYNLGFTLGAYNVMKEYYGDPDFQEKLGNCFTGLRCEPAGSWTEIRPDVWKDQFGVEWNKSVDKDIGVVCNRIISPDTIDSCIFPDPEDPSRYSGYEAVLNKSPDQFTIVNLGFSLYERAWTLTGMEELMIAMMTDTPFVNKLLDKILEFNLGVIEHACSYPVDAMMFGDDWGTQTGLQMGPDLWRHYIKPRVREMYAAVKAHGKYVFIHSCGKVDEIFPDLIECGLDMFNPFQPEVIDVFNAKRQYGSDLCFYGGISTQNLLPYGTVSQVRQAVNRLLEEIGKDGGYISAPAHAIPGDAKPENIAALIEVLQNQ